MITGDDLAKHLTESTTPCPKCGRTIQFQEGSNCAQNHGIHDKVVMCRYCHSIYQVHLTPRQMTITANVTMKYPQVAEKYKKQTRRCELCDTETELGRSYKFHYAKCVGKTSFSTSELYDPVQNITETRYYENIYEYTGYCCNQCIVELDYQRLSQSPTNMAIPWWEGVLRIFLITLAVTFVFFWWLGGVLLEYSWKVSLAFAFFVASSIAMAVGHMGLETLKRLEENHQKRITIEAMLDRNDATAITEMAHSLKEYGDSALISKHSPDLRTEGFDTFWTSSQYLKASPQRQSVHSSLLKH